DQLEVHLLRQAADVVVRFDHVGLAALSTGRFDDVRVDGALGEELDVVQLAGLGIEDVDEGAADDLALLLRIGFAGEILQELRFGIGTDHLDAHVLGEHGHHLVAFVQAQQAVVDKYAGQLLADGLVQQRRDHRGIDAAGKAQQYVSAAHLGAHLLDQVFDDIRGGPEVFTAADFQQKARQDAPALLGMGHFRVELHAIVAAGLVTDRGDRAALRAGDDVETFRDLGDLVAVAPPDVAGAHAAAVPVGLDDVERLRLAHRIGPPTVRTT